MAGKASCMTSDLLILLLLVVVVLTGSALCSGVEAAYGESRGVPTLARPRPVTEHDDWLSFQRLGRTLSVLVIANNGFNIFGSLMLGGYASVVFTERINAGSIALPLFSVSLTVLVILLGDLLKAIGSRRPCLSPWRALQSSLAQGDDVPTVRCWNACRQPSSRKTRSHRRGGDRHGEPGSQKGRSKPSRPR